MGSKSITAEKLYSIEELSEILGVSVKTVRNKISSRGLRKVKSLNRLSLYSKAHLEALQVKKQRPLIKDGYYIYESKINNQ